MRKWWGGWLRTFGAYWGVLVCAKFDDIEWHSGFQPLMALNGGALQRSA